MRRLLTLLTFSIFLSACDDDDPTNGGGLANNCYDGGCTTEALPLVDSADAPTITDVALECQSGRIVVLATATDPQGTDNLLGVNQSIGLYPDVDCQGTLITVQDDLAGSGLEESFGDVVLASANQALYDQICDCNSWPVEVQFEDLNGNVTDGLVLARVTR